MALGKLQVLPQPPGRSTSLQRCHEEQVKGIGDPPACMKSNAVAFLTAGQGRDRQGGWGKELALEPPGQESGGGQERQQLLRSES